MGRAMLDVPEVLEREVLEIRCLKGAEKVLERCQRCLRGVLKVKVNSGC
jgi:hypothetical protein